MIIRAADGTPIIKVAVDDDSFAYTELMQTEELQLHFSLTQHVEIPLGAYCRFPEPTTDADDDALPKYVLLTPESVKIIHRRNYEYTITFEGAMGMLRKYKIHNMVDGRLKFDLTAKPIEHLQQLVANLNERASGITWYAYGSESGEEIVDSDEKLVSYNHTDCKSAIVAIAQAFNTEWYIERTGSTYAIHLAKAEFNADDPLRNGSSPLSYGEGHGFRSGISRTNFDDRLPIAKLFVQGGDKNIDYSKYPNANNHSHTLLLPRNLSFGFDGEFFEWEDDYDASKGVAMHTDLRGFSVRLTDAATYGDNEDSLDCSEIYPKRVGTTTLVLYRYRGSFYPLDVLASVLGHSSASQITDDEWAKVSTFIFDNTIPATLDYGDCLLEGSTMTLIFQSGSLAGREFDVQWTIDPTYGKGFLIVKEEIDGQIMPAPTAFLPAAGDTYAVFNCMLPDAYIADPTTHTGAEYDMLREAAKYLYDNKDAKYTFKGELDPIWVKRNWDSITESKLRVGGVVRFYDPQVQVAPFDIRILSVKRLVNNPKAPTIELSNDPQGGGLRNSLQELKNEAAHTEDLNDTAVAYTRRSFSAAKETADMLAAVLTGYGGAANPISVQTMNLLVGDESLQFFAYSNAACTQRFAPVTYDNATKVLTCAECWIKHFSYGQGNVEAQAATSRTCQVWHIPARTFNFSSIEGARYVYLNCQTTPTITSTILQGTFEIIDDLADEVGDVGQMWKVGYFLFGIVTSEIEGQRSYTDVFGFTEINPARVTTDKIVSLDGNNFIDLLANKFRIGNNNSSLDWNNETANTLRIKNADIDIYNANDNQVVHIDKDDGSAFFAEGDFNIDADGYITFKGMRKPFIQFGSGWGQQKQDHIIGSLQSSGSHLLFGLTWDVSQAGRRIVIFGGSYISAPSGFYFWEGGRPADALSTRGDEMTELIGLGTSTTFYGWWVLSRHDYKPTRAYGRDLRPLCYGSWRNTALNQLRAYAFDSRYNLTPAVHNNYPPATFAMTNPSSGTYRLTITTPYKWVNEADKYTGDSLVVFATPFGTGTYNGSTMAMNVGVKAVTINTNSIIIDFFCNIMGMYALTPDSGAGFNFVIYNLLSWLP